jgi:hypothetical protein
MTPPKVTVSLLVPFEFFVNFKNAFAKQEQAAHDQDQVLARDGQLPGENFRLPERLIEFHDQGETTQQQHAGDERQAETEPAGLGLLVGGEFAAENRDENDVINAEHDLQQREREQADPNFRL